MRTRNPTTGYAHVSQAAHSSTVWFSKPLPQNRDIFMSGGGNGTLCLWKYHYPPQRSVQDSNGDLEVCRVYLNVNNLSFSFFFFFPSGSSRLSWVTSRNWGLQSCCCCFQFFSIRWALSPWCLWTGTRTVWGSAYSHHSTNLSKSLSSLNSTKFSIETFPRTWRNEKGVFWKG